MALLAARHQHLSVLQQHGGEMKPPGVHRRSAVPDAGRLVIDLRAGQRRGAAPESAGDQDQTVLQSGGHRVVAWGVQRAGAHPVPRGRDVALSRGEEADGEVAPAGDQHRPIGQRRCGVGEARRDERRRRAPPSTCGVIELSGGKHPRSVPAGDEHRPPGRAVAWARKRPWWRLPVLRQRPAPTAAPSAAAGTASTRSTSAIRSVRRPLVIAARRARWCAASASTGS